MVSALPDALNSTGSVISSKRTASENIIIPTSISVGLIPKNSPAAINIHERLEAILTTGAIVLRIRSGAYPTSCCIACPHS